MRRSISDVQNSRNLRNNFLKEKKGVYRRSASLVRKKSSGQNDETKFDDLSKTYRLEATNETPLLVIFQQVKTMYEYYRLEAYEISHNLTRDMNFKIIFKATRKTDDSHSVDSKSQMLNWHRPKSLPVASWVATLKGLTIKTT